MRDKMFTLENNLYRLKAQHQWNMSVAYGNKMQNSVQKSNNVWAEFTPTFNVPKNPVSTYLDFKLATTEVTNDGESSKAAVTRRGVKHLVSADRTDNVGSMRIGGVEMFFQNTPPI
jgi:hypothetical protein